MGALDLEGKQDWIGVSIDKSIEIKFAGFFEKDRFIMKIKNQNDEKMVYLNPNIVRYSVPMKCGHSELLYTVNWLDRCSLLDASSGEILPNIDFIDNFKKALPLCLENQRKYKNTLNYINYINSIMPVDELGFVHHDLKEDVYT